MKLYRCFALVEETEVVNCLVFANSKQVASNRVKKMLMDERDLTEKEIKVLNFLEKPFEPAGISCRMDLGTFTKEDVEIVNAMFRQFC